MLYKKCANVIQKNVFMQKEPFVLFVRVNIVINDDKSE